MTDHSVEPIAAQSLPNKPREGAVLYPWLDWIRFGAALQVLFVHARFFTFVEYSDLSPASKNKFSTIGFALTRTGLEAVLVFFVLSGFLVGGKVIERVSNGTFDWKSYSIDRFSRIYTPLVPALLFALFIELFFKSHPSLGEYLGNLLSLQDIFVAPVHTIGSIWSLSYEVWFYILAGSLAVTFLNRRRPSIIAIVLLLASLSIFGQLSASFLFCWVLGAFVYLFPQTRLSRSEIITGIFLFVLGSVLIQLSSSSHSLRVLNQFQIIGPTGQLILSSGIALVLRNLCTVTVIPATESSIARMGTTLAKFSYTLYLIHYPVMVAMEKVGYSRQSAVSQQTLALYGLRILLSLVVSYLFYLVFERNTPLVKRFLRVVFESKRANIKG